jgi:FkbM family methyltransferase
MKNGQTKNLEAKLSKLYDLRRSRKLPRAKFSVKQALVEVSWLRSIMKSKGVHDSEYHDFYKALKLCGIDHVLDIGANYGYSATSLLNLGFSGKIFCIEPLREHAVALEYLRWAWPSNVRYRTIALGRQRGRLRLLTPTVGSTRLTALSFSSSTSVNISSLAENVQHHMDTYLEDEFGFEDVSLSRVKVKVRTLDEVFPRVQRSWGREPHTKFAIKIDAEGSEFEILSGATKTISTYSPLIFLEGVNEKVRETLVVMGYSEVLIAGHSLVRADAVTTTVNKLFLRV